MSLRRDLVGNVWLLAVVALFTGGCGEELGRDPFVTASVSGRVRRANEPIRGGWIEFLPTDAAVGPMRSAPISEDGRFHADGVPVGPVRVGIVGAPLGPEERGLFGSLPTPIRRVIPPQGDAALDVDLANELSLYRVNSAGYR